jgi:hypothetical protein
VACDQLVEVNNVKLPADEVFPEVRVVEEDPKKPVNKNGSS